MGWEFPSQPAKAALPTLGATASGCYQVGGGQWQVPRHSRQLVVNLKAAKMLGVTIPQSLLLQADEVVQ
jgi:hypothetical protein